VSMVILLLIAGFETTTNLIGNGTLALLENPEQKELLIQQPGLMRSAIEELLRYYSPVEISTERYAREPITIGGMTIPKEAMVGAVLGSANRDESAFHQPDVLDITRDPNKHLAFGQGIHYCLGAPLARLEGQIALDTLLQRFPTLRLAAPHDTLRWKGGIILRSLESLPVTWDARRVQPVAQVERIGV
jgi:cytochrome P450